MSSIWPLFGISNQLLAECALIVCTTMLIRLNRGRYALCSAIPGVLMAVVTFWAGYLQVVDSYLPSGQYMLASLAIAAMMLMGFVFVAAFRKWYRLLAIQANKTDLYGETVKEDI